MIDMNNLPRSHYGAILADPPWSFVSWSENGEGRSAKRHYGTMDVKEMVRLPVSDLAAKDCALFCWATWPQLKSALWLMSAWGFEYKTCAFNWIKGNGTQIELFDDEIIPSMKMGYWTRSSSEVCLLATRGKPKRLNADVRQGIIAPAREHSRKPDGIHSRIERLVAGPYLELFARAPRTGWTVWGNETGKFKEAAE